LEESPEPEEELDVAAAIEEVPIAAPEEGPGEAGLDDAADFDQTAEADTASQKSIGMFLTSTLFLDL
jgi:hypothetical protein